MLNFTPLMEEAFTNYSRALDMQIVGAYLEALNPHYREDKVVEAPLRHPLKDPYAKTY